MNQTKSHNPSINANNISFDARADISILKNLTVSFNGEKTGLVGRNGIGKTTFLRLLVGEMDPSSGSIVKYGSIAYMPQDHGLDLDQTVAESLGVKDILESLEKIKDGDKSPEIIASIGDDWDMEERVEKILKQFRLDDVKYDRKLSSLSGGERTKIILAKLLISSPDFLILDEPTNNLDAKSREAVYGLIRSWQGGLLVVSHDRQLLNLLDQILELSDQGLKVYGGNFDNYKTQKKFEDQAAQRQLTSAEQNLKKTKKLAHRTKEKQQKRSSQGKKNKVKSGVPKIILGMMKETSETTSSRLAELHSKRIESATSRLSEAQAKISPENEIVVDLSGANVPNGKLIVSLENVDFSYGRNQLFKKYSFRLDGPVRLDLNGANGSGKTTLIKLMLGELKPSHGIVTLGVANFSYLDQTVAILDRGETLLDNLKNISRLDDTSARNWLARFLFSGEDVFKKVGLLSGGERMRGALACILAGENLPELLVLDEPTNNLDLDSIEQIESILLNYHGALIVISHDKTFLENIGIKDEINLS